jgi:surface protein
MNSPPQADEKFVSESSVPLSKRIEACAFNQDLSWWNTGKVTIMEAMFDEKGWLTVS